MSGALVTVTMDRVSQVPKDRIVNTWAINQYVPDGGTDDQALLSAFTQFYATDPTGQTASVSEFFGHSLSRAAGDAVFRLYDLDGHLDGSPHGSPVSIKNHQIDVADVTQTPLPDEVSVCLTLEGTNRSSTPVEVGTTRPMSRRTGRVFLGPLNTKAVAVVDGYARVATAFTSVVLAALGDLQDDVQAVQPAADLGVWSRKDAEIYAIEAAYIDNEFDTQRRRGVTATSRTRVLIA